MLIKGRMSSPVITVEPKLPIMDALELMKSKGIRRTPVMKDGKLIGIISDKDLLNAAPSDATSLSVWELNYLLGKITVSEIMTKDVFTVTEDTPLEEAAYLMAAEENWRSARHETWSPGGLDYRNRSVPHFLRTHGGTTGWSACHSPGSGPGR